MSKFDSPLKDIKIASPCSANWDEMYGNERKRFCGDCKMNVYDLSGMTKAEAENLIFHSEGRLCVRFYKRADGTVITKDCPVGLAKVKQQMTRFAVAACSLVLTFFAGLAAFMAFREQSDGGFKENKNIFVRMKEKIEEPPVIMGEIATPEKREPKKNRELKVIERTRTVDLSRTSR